ncbi:MAG: hypothetical protein M3680_25940 [Myxococcota bacterium]|nr:hypothetical protein [Myxococcota bacterium]
MQKSFALTLLAACGTLVTACGDNLGPNSGVTPDASGPDGTIAPSRAVVVSGDFITPGFTGVMSSLALETMEVQQRVSPNGSIGNDPMLRKVGNELFIVNRADGNNVTILDATTFALVEQLATGAGANPQDVAVVGDQLYVPATGTAGLVVLTRGSTTITTIDLGDLDPDGKPDCVSAYRVGNLVYVACGLLDQTFTPRGPGKVVVIDTTTNTRTATVTLSSVNPFGVFEALPGAGGLVIPTVSFADVTVGCVERITTGGTPASAGCLVPNSELGGFVGRIAVQPIGTTDMMWMVVANGMFGPGERSQLWGYDLGTSTLWADPVTPGTQLLVDVAVCPDDHVVVADKGSTENGLRVYLGGTEKTTAPKAIGLKPGSSHGLVCY